MIKFFKSLFSRNEWKSLDSPPEKGHRVLLKCKTGDVYVAHLDPEIKDLWVVFIMEISGQNYKFKVEDALQWKEIPQ